MSTTSVQRDPSEATVPDAIRARVLRGIALYADRGEEIEPQGKGRYQVPSGARDPGEPGGNYTVDLAVFDGEESCTCPDYQRYHDTCKHLVAASIFRAKLFAIARRRRSKRYSPQAVESNLARLSA